MEFTARAYGKNGVKLMYLNRQGDYHSIQEYEVDTQISLTNDKDYIEGDNSDVIATDTQKNTVYILAKKHGVRFPEQFGLILTNHFLNTYPHVTRARVKIVQHPWRHLYWKGVEHRHVFISSPEATRSCVIEHKRFGKPQIRASVTGLRLLKSTQSAFVNFHSDEYRSLPDASDRIFSTIVNADWDYSTVEGVDFCGTWQEVKQLIVKHFAGPPDTGVFSPSVQYTLYVTLKDVLEKIPQISSMAMELPNKHYLTFDLSKFPGVGSSHNNEVFQPVDKPSGNITARLARKTASKL